MEPNSQGKCNLAKAMTVGDQIFWPPNSINACSGRIRTRINYPVTQSDKGLRAEL